MELFSDFYTGLPQRYKDEVRFKERQKNEETRYEHRYIDPDRQYHKEWYYTNRNLVVMYKNQRYLIGHDNDVYFLMYDVVSDILEEYGILQKGLEVLKRGGKCDDRG